MGRRDGLLERKQRVVLLVVFQTAASAFVMEGAGHFGWSCGVAANVSDEAVFTRNGLIICLCAGRNVVPDQRDRFGRRLLIDIDSYNLRHFDF